MKKWFITFLSTAVLLFAAIAFAADEDSSDKDAKYNQVATACESQFTADQYPDEEERNAKIDACIEEGMQNQGESQPVEG